MNKRIALFAALALSSGIGMSSSRADDGLLTCAIQTFGGQYLTAVGGGGQVMDPIHTDADHVRDWERFRLVPLGHGHYAIATDRGYYLTAVGGGDRTDDVIHTDATQIQDWEKFRLVELDDGYYAIRTHKGRYLTAVNGGGETDTDTVLHTDATRIREWEVFRFICDSSRHHKLERAKSDDDADMKATYSEEPVAAQAGRGAANGSAAAQ